MNEQKNAALAEAERRQGAAKSVWGELVIESAWRPSDKPKVETDWLRSHGYLPERRQPRSSAKVEFHR